MKVQKGKLFFYFFLIESGVESHALETGFKCYEWISD